MFKFKEKTNLKEFPITKKDKYYFQLTYGYQKNGIECEKIVQGGVENLNNIAFLNKIEERVINLINEECLN